MYLTSYGRLVGLRGQNRITWQDIASGFGLSMSAEGSYVACRRRGSGG